jgi:hypothetical protein
MADSSTPVAAPWYKSAVLHSLIVILVTKTLTHYKIIDQYTAVDVGAFADDVLNVVGYIAIAVAGIARVRSPLAPVTITQKQANAANAVAVPEVAKPADPAVADPKLPEGEPNAKNPFPPGAGPTT